MKGLSPFRFDAVKGARPRASRPQTRAIVAARREPSGIAGENVQRRHVALLESSASDRRPHGLPLGRSGPRASRPQTRAMVAARREPSGIARENVQRRYVALLEGSASDRRPHGQPLGRNGPRASRPQTRAMVAARRKPSGVAREIVQRRYVALLEGSASDQRPNGLPRIPRPPLAFENPCLRGAFGGECTGAIRPPSLPYAHIRDGRHIPCLGNE
jgi:hypothetical protein